MAAASSVSAACRGRTAGQPGFEILRKDPREMVGDVLDEARAAELRERAGQQELDRDIDLRGGRVRWIERHK